VTRGGPGADDAIRPAAFPARSRVGVFDGEDNPKARTKQMNSGIDVSYGPDATRICLDRPPVNAFTAEMLTSFAAAMADGQTDPRPLLISGASGVFSAGFDIKHPAPDPLIVNALARTCISAVQGYPGLTIAAVDGAAVGLGLLIAASADILLLSRNARLRMPEVTLGIASDVQPLRRLLPDPWIRRLCLLGETTTAEQMHLDDVGVTLCDPSTARARAEDVIKQASGLDADAVREIKQRLRE
jgi:enoyl-CoA hydratase